MKILRHAMWTVAMIGMFWSNHVSAQATGDYRSVATGNWSEASTWETFDGTNWIAATAAPTGTDTITVGGEDSVRVDVAVGISGYVRVQESGVLEITGGSLEFGDGSTYAHARDEGSIPTSTWNEGSTLLMTGITGSAPDNRNQNYYNITFNTPNLSSNQDMGLDDVTIGGDITVLSSGSSRWRLTSASAGDTAIVTLMGDLIIEDGAFETQGTGNALTTFIVHHYGNINITGGTFGISRGSQGSGSGTTTWYLYEGNFAMSNAEIRNSNPTPGNAKFVFAKGDTQTITFDSVEFGGGDIHYEVSDSSTMQITQDFSVNGLLVNKGAVDALGTLTFIDDGAVYEHARDGGSVPTSVWLEGSTALFTGITGSAPDNRGQDYYNITLNTPGLLSNRDLSLDGNTVSGDITVISTGSARWQLVGGSSGTVTIMGDVFVQDGQFATQGTGSATDVVVDHYGNIEVTGGNFSVSRGSQSSGTGTTTWNLHEGNFSMSNATTQNSNPTPGNAKFVFAKDGTQTLTLGEGNTLNAFPLEVSSGTILDVGVSEIGGDDVFILNASATLATAHPDGIDGTLQTSGDITLSKEASFTFNGTEAQASGASLPDSVNVLTIANPTGVSFNDTLWSAAVLVSSASIMQIDTLGSVTTDSGSVNGTVVNKGVLGPVFSFWDGAVYEHARNGGAIPEAVWFEGSTLLMTGSVDSAPGNRNQNYYNVTFNTPGLLSNLDMGLDDVTIGGDINVQSTGSARWRLTSASAGDTSIVTIMGDVIVEDGSFETQGTGNALTVFEVHHHGNVVVTGGNFSVARGSQGSGSGSTRWYMHEGDFSMSDATTQNSNSANAWFVFDDTTGVQALELSNVNYGGGGLAIEVANGATLDFGASELGGSGLFVLNAGATLATAHEFGIGGAVQSTGDVTLDEAANYIFNGTTAQITSTHLPTTVNDLTIDNAAGVTLTQETTINGVLRLIAGVFDNTIMFTLGPNGSISFEGGSLAVPTSVADVPQVPIEFALFQNYPNPFNPSTTIRFDVPERTDVTLTIYDIMGREVVELVNTKHEAGAYEIVWNARGYASGVYYYRISAGDFVSVRKLILMK